jgi:ABC-2 type transport system permease protein
MMRKLLAFLKRDLLELVSYRFRLFLSLGGMLVGVFFLYFIGRTFNNSFSEYLARYGNDYFAFALLGMSVSSFVSTGLYSLATQVREAQVQGTLEALLVTPTSPNMILFGNSLWSFLESFLDSLLYLGIAIVIIGLKVSMIQIALVLLILGLTFLCFLSLGMISAAFIMAFKQGNPINLLFGTSSYFLGGLLFPVEVLPLPLQKASFFLPITHAARAVREILLVPGNQGDWLSTIIFLGAFALIVGPAGLCLLRLSLSRAKREGSLVQF